jgi:hypothetical protein
VTWRTGRAQSRQIWLLSTRRSSRCRARASASTRRPPPRSRQIGPSLPSHQQRKNPALPHEVCRLPWPSPPALWASHLCVSRFPSRPRSRSLDTLRETAKGTTAWPSGSECSVGSSGQGAQTARPKRSRRGCCAGAGRFPLRGASSCGSRPRAHTAPKGGVLSEHRAFFQDLAQARL